MSEVSTHVSHFGAATNSKGVSIGVPVFNGELTIARSIRSLQNQTFGNFEIIISDNASTDSTEAVCRQIAAQDPRIRYIRQPQNKGSMENFRFVLMEARNDYFMFAAADDEWDPRFIECLLNILNNDEECVLAFCDFAIKYRETGEEILIPVSSSCSKSPNGRYISRLIDMQPHLIYGLFRRKYLFATDLPGFDFTDCHVSLIMALRGRIRIANELLYTWVISVNRKSYSITHKQIRYLGFWLAQVRLIFTKFSIFKAVLPIALLTFFLITKKREHLKQRGTSK